MMLDSKQQQMLARAAALLPSAQQESFRSSVIGVLDAMLVRPPSDASLRDVLQHVLALRGVAIGAAALLPPPQQRRYVHDRSSNAWRGWHKPTARPPKGDFTDAT